MSKDPQHLTKEDYILDAAIALNIVPEGTPVDHHKLTTGECHWEAISHYLGGRLATALHSLQEEKKLTERMRLDADHNEALIARLQTRWRSKDKGDASNPPLDDFGR